MTAKVGFKIILIFFGICQNVLFPQNLYMKLALYRYGKIVSAVFVDLKYAV